jgi:hypothetical protein
MITVILLGVYLHRKAHLGKARKTMCQNFLAIQVPSICGFLPFQVPNFRVNSSGESLKGENSCQHFPDLRGISVMSFELL